MSVAVAHRLDERQQPRCHDLGIELAPEPVNGSTTGSRPRPLVVQESDERRGGSSGIVEGPETTFDSFVEEFGDPAGGIGPGRAGRRPWPR